MNFQWLIKSRTFISSSTRSEAQQKIIINENLNWNYLPDDWRLELAGLWCMIFIVVSVFMAKRWPLMDKIAFSKTIKLFLNCSAIAELNKEIFDFFFSRFDRWRQPSIRALSVVGWCRSHRRKDWKLAQTNHERKRSPNRRERNARKQWKEKELNESFSFSARKHFYFVFNAKIKSEKSVTFSLFDLNVRAKSKRTKDLIRNAI